MRANFIPSGPVTFGDGKVLRLSYQLGPAARRRDRRTRPDAQPLTELTIHRAERRAERILAEARFRILKDAL